MKLGRIAEIDFSMIVIVSILTIFGILFIYSSAITSTGILVSNEYIKQMIWGGAGLILALSIALIDYRRYYDFSMYIYIALLLLLIYTRLFGRVVNGARSWVGVGSFGIQPSEFTKIATILFLARYLDASRRTETGIRRFLVSCVIVFIPMLLILAQPDLGTALVFIPILIVMTFIAGIPLRFVAYLGFLISFTGFLAVLPLWERYILNGQVPLLNLFTDAASVAVLILAFSLVSAIALLGYRRYKKKYFYWISYFSTLIVLSLAAAFAARKILKEYQIMRLIVFLDPEVDPRGSGWNIIQSITAIGSGGLFGKGFLQGTQSHYRFLPQQSTDFIFSIFSEEWGFLGGLLVFSLFLALSLRLIRIMKTTSDPYGASIAAGLSAIYMFHFLINVGMTMGVMPITGIPLLFMSYGGSSLLAAMIGIGLALSIYMRRYEH
ncbi:rod shape-determining protein RodA [Treponema sp.]